MRDCRGLRQRGRGRGRGAGWSKPEAEGDAGESSLSLGGDAGPATSRPSSPLQFCLKTPALHEPSFSLSYSILQLRDISSVPLSEPLCCSGPRWEPPDRRHHLAQSGRPPAPPVYLAASPGTAFAGAAQAPCRICRMSRSGGCQSSGGMGSSQGGVLLSSLFLLPFPATFLFPAFIPCRSPSSCILPIARRSPACAHCHSVLRVVSCGLFWGPVHCTLTFARK